MGLCKGCWLTCILQTILSAACNATRMNYACNMLLCSGVWGSCKACRWIYACSGVLVCCVLHCIGVLRGQALLKVGMWGCKACC